VSVIAQIVVESRRYSGWLDHRYPIGYWQAALSLTGNASGGVLGIDLVFQGAVPAFLNSQIYSVERFAIRSNDVADRDMTVVAVNMGGPANQGFNHEYNVPVLFTTDAGRASMAASAMALVPWFLGSQRTPGITASLSLVADNIDPVIVTFEAEGYRWSPRSVLVDGGPQRPPTGPYRT